MELMDQHDVYTEWRMNFLSADNDIKRRCGIDKHNVYCLNACNDKSRYPIRFSFPLKDLVILCNTSVRFHAELNKISPFTGMFYYIRFIDKAGFIRRGNFQVLESDPHINIEREIKIESDNNIYFVSPKNFIFVGIVIKDCFFLTKQFMELFWFNQYHVQLGKRVVNKILNSNQKGLLL